MVNQGYKQTEIGVIPEDWNLTPIGDIADFQGGSQPDIKYFTNRETKDNIRLIQIRDYKSDKYITYIPLCLAKRFCSKDDIMIGRYGPPIFQILRGLEGAYNVALIKTIPKNVCKEFLYYVLKDQKLFEYIELLSRRSSGQTGVDLEGLRNYTIPCPSLPEQSRIAEALSDVDSMISSLEKLIAKKKAIKQGTMQELLTGKKRLPGFTGEWKCEANIFSFSKGTQINSSLLNETDIYPVYNGGREPSGFTDKFNCSRSIIISEGGNSCGFVNMVRQNFWAGGHCYYVYETVLDYEFLYHLLKFNENEIMGLRVGSGLPNIQKDALSKLEFTYPFDMLEQTAIASIISDMDNEIESLEQKLAKARKVKQGMMQQLLTGKIRLV